MLVLGAALALFVLGAAAVWLLRRPAGVVRVAGRDYPLSAAVTTDPEETWAYEPTAPVQDLDWSDEQLVLLQRDEQGSILTSVGVDAGTRAWEIDIGEFSGSMRLIEDVVVLSGRFGDDATPAVRGYQIGDNRELWEEELDGSEGTVLQGEDTAAIAVAVRNDGGEYDEVVSLDVRSGDRRWSKGVDGTRAYVGGEQLYLVGDGEIVAYRLDDGTSAWTSTELDSADGLVEVGGTVAVASGDDKGTVVGLDSDDGQRLWEQDVADEYVSEMIEIDDSTVGVLSGDRLYAVATDGGAERWRVRSQHSPFVVSGGSTMVVGLSPNEGDDDRVLVTDASDGQQVASINTKIRMQSAFPADGAIYLGESGTTDVYAFDLESGERLWKWNGPDAGEQPQPRPSSTGTTRPGTNDGQTETQTDTASSGTSFPIAVGGAVVVVTEDQVIRLD